jgi:hypothetical protein
VFLDLSAAVRAVIQRFALPGNKAYMRIIFVLKDCLEHLMVNKYVVQWLSVVLSGAQQSTAFAAT